MLAKAGRTTRQNGLTLFEGTHGCSGGNIGFKKKFTFFVLNFFQSPLAIPEISASI